MPVDLLAFLKKKAALSRCPDFHLFTIISRIFIAETGVDCKASRDEYVYSHFSNGRKDKKAKMLEVGVETRVEIRVCR